VQDEALVPVDRVLDLEPVVAEVRDPGRVSWARRTKPAREVKRM
jgi:hypothetical protein